MYVAVILDDKVYIPCSLQLKVRFRDAGAIATAEIYYIIVPKEYVQRKHIIVSGSAG